MHRLHPLPPMKVAEELLLIDSSALRKILPDELVDEAWVGKRKEELSPNITAMVNHFNCLALLVPTEILAEDTPQMRAKVIAIFIKVAEACHQLKNYHSLKAVLAGLQCTPIYRLKKSWKRVPAPRMRSFQKLSALMGEEGNCILYHREMSLNVDKEIPFVPYLGFFLTQIVHQACHQKMQQGHPRIELTRKGAILKHYKIHTSTTVSSSQSDEDDASIHSWPTGHHEPGSPVAQSCPTRCEDLSSSAPCNSRVNSASLGYMSDDAAAPSSAADTSNRDSFDAKQAESATPTLHLHLTTDDCLTSGQNPSTLPFSSSMLFSPLKPHMIQKSLSAEPLHLQYDSGARDELPTPSPLSVPTYLSLEDLDAQSEPCDLQQQEQGEEEDDGPLCRKGNSQRTRSSTSVAKSNTDEYRAVSLFLPSSGVHSADTDAAGNRDNICVSPLVCSTRLSLAPEVERGEETGEAASGHSKCLTMVDARGPHLSKHATSTNQAGQLHRRCALYRPKDATKFLHSPKDLLNKYQICSMGCANGIQSGEDIRNLITNYHCNTEMENYVLSYQKEPQ